VKPLHKDSKRIAPSAPTNCKHKPSAIKERCHLWPKRSSRMTSSHLSTASVIGYESKKDIVKHDDNCFLKYETLGKGLPTASLVGFDECLL